MLQTTIEDVAELICRYRRLQPYKQTGAKHMYTLVLGQQYEAWRTDPPGYDEVEDIVFCKCCTFGHDIYEGEECYNVDSDMVCDGCTHDYMRQYRVVARL